jgi:O-antigen/teichoic acid export membrane protein
MSVLHRNLLWLFVSQVATWLASILLLILAPVRLGAENYGRFQFVAAFVGFFSLVGSLGSYSYIVKSIAKDHARAGHLVFAAMQVKVVLGTILAGLALALGWLLSYNREIMILIGVSCAFMIVVLLNEMFVAGLAGMERMAGTAFWSTVQVYVSTILAIVVLMTSRSLVLYALAFGIGWLCPFVANYFRLRPIIRDRPRGEAPFHKAIVLGGLPFVALSILTLFYGTIDIPILQSISGSTVVGWYALAYRWVTIPVFITTIVGTAFLPRLSTLAVTARDEFCNLTNQAIQLVLFVSIPASVGIMMTSSGILHFLYHDQFDHSIGLMQILALHIPIAAMDTVLATALIASDRQNRYLVVAVVAAILNPALDVFAIRLTMHRYGNGAIGASIVTVATEAFIMTCALALRSPGVMDRRTMAYILRCLVAVTPMAGVLWLMSDVELFVRIAAGGAVYAIASLGLRTISFPQLRQLAKEFGRRGTAVPLPHEAQ